MSRRQNTSHIFMGNQNIFFPIDLIRCIRFASSQVGYSRHLYTQNVKIEQVFIILSIIWEWLSNWLESAFFSYSQIIYNLANNCHRT